MDSRVTIRLAELEHAVQELQQRLAREDARRRRAGTLRVVALALLGLAYVVMFKQAGSLMG